MKIQKSDKVKACKSKDLEKNEVESNPVEDLVPKKKKRSSVSLNVSTEDTDQSPVKKIKKESSDELKVDTPETNELKVAKNSTEELKKKIDMISSKGTLSKSARKHLAKLKRKLYAEIGETESKEQTDEKVEEACEADEVKEDPEDEINIPKTESEKKASKKLKNEDDTKEVTPKNDKEEKKVNQSNKQIGKDQQKKIRYVLFVGNIPYSTKVEDIKNHFLQQVSKVVSVRIPLVKQSNEPRGFAYVEFSNSTDYEKALSLHESQFNGRRINVQYTQSGSKKAGNKSEIIKKNQKLHYMRKQGQLAGSKKRNDKSKFQRHFKKHQGLNKF